MLNDMVDDSMFKTYYRSCTADLCNDSDGIRSLNKVKISPDGYDGENLLVPGLPFNRSSRQQLSVYVMPLVCFMTAIKKIIR